MEREQRGKGREGGREGKGTEGKSEGKRERQWESGMAEKGGRKRGWILTGVLGV